MKNEISYQHKTLSLIYDQQLHMMSVNKIGTDRAKIRENGYPSCREKERE
jgi:hypothetical protein